MHHGGHMHRVTGASTTVVINSLHIQFVTASASRRNLHPRSTSVHFLMIPGGPQHLQPIVQTRPLVGIRSLRLAVSLHLYPKRIDLVRANIREIPNGLYQRTLVERQIQGIPAITFIRVVFIDRGTNRVSRIRTRKAVKASQPIEMNHRVILVGNHPTDGILVCTGAHLVHVMRIGINRDRDITIVTIL